MKFGIALDYLEKGLSPRANFDICLRLVREARDAGFDLVYHGHRFLEPYYVEFQALPVLARLLADAGDMLAVWGDLVPLNHPVRVAESLATLDIMSGGRAILLAVTGYQRNEFEAFGVERRTRTERVREVCEIVARLLVGERVTHHSEYYHLDDVMLGGGQPPMSNPRPAIWGTAHRNAGVARAASYADAWFISHQPTRSELLPQVRRFAAARAGREAAGYHECEDHGIRLPLLREAFVARTTSEAIELARVPMMEVAERYMRSDQMAELNDPRGYDQPFAEWRRERAIVGDPEEATREIRAYQEELGVDCVVFKLYRAGISLDKVLAAIELIGDEVIPAFR